MRALVGIPPLHAHESPASWLTRAALSQCVHVEELMAYFGLPINRDPDLMMAGRVLSNVVDLSGQPVSSFGFAAHMFSGLKNIDPDGEHLLLWTKKGRPRYRFCPLCLHEPGGAYFPLHWRFSVWRWCPIHDCLLSECCPHCRREVILPGSMFVGGRKREGVAFLDRCLHCAGSLDAGWESIKELRIEETTGSWEKALLINGRAVLAAIFHRKFSITGSDRQHSLKKLMRLKKMGLLPLDMSMLSGVSLTEHVRMSFLESSPEVAEV